MSDCYKALVVLNFVFLVLLRWIVTVQDTLFLDKAGGGYFSTPEGDPSILFRVKDDYDGAEPSPNSVSAINLVRLSLFLHGNGSDYFRRTAEHLLVSLSILCMYLCFMYVCIHGCKCMYVCTVFIYAHMYVFMDVCIYTNVHVCFYV